MDHENRSIGDIVLSHAALRKLAHEDAHLKAAQLSVSSLWRCMHYKVEDTFVMSRSLAALHPGIERIDSVD